MCERTTQRTAPTPAPRKKKKKTKVNAMERLKKVTRKDPFWKSLETECNQKLEQFDTVPGQTVDEDYRKFKNSLNEAVSSTFQHTKPFFTTLRAKIQSTPALKSLRKKKAQLFAKMKAEEKEESRKAIKKELSLVSRKLKSEARKAINEYKRNQVLEIERLQANDARRMWKELKALSGWRRKEKLEDTVLDEKREEVSGEEVIKVWREAFRKLGVEDVKDPKFDSVFCAQIIERQETIEAESREEKNFNPELDTPITEMETKHAIGNSS